MILEHAILPIRPGLEVQFEEAFNKAQPLISSQPGFLSVVLSRSIETPNLYLLLVEWDSVEAHVEGFRMSPEYTTWKHLLHLFYDPFPTVEHFAVVTSAVVTSAEVASAEVTSAKGLSRGATPNPMLRDTFG